MKKHWIALTMVFALMVFATAPAWAAQHHQQASPSNSGGGSFDQGMVVIGGESDFTVAGGAKHGTSGKNSSDTPWAHVNFDVFSGYFVIRGVEVGGFVNVGYSKNDTKITIDNASETELNTSTEWWVGPQAGYFYQIIHNFGLFGRLDVGYGGTNTVGGTKDDKTTTNDSGFIVRPVLGGVVLITKNVGLDFSLYFKYYAGSGSVKAPNVDSKATTVSEPSGGLRVGILGFL